MLDLESLKRFRDFKFEILTRIPEWARAYEVDDQAIMRQIPIAHAWINANPKKAPKKDPVRFLYNWMRIAKKMGNLISKSSDRIYKEPTPEDDVMTAEDFAEMRKLI